MCAIVPLDLYPFLSETENVIKKSAGFNRVVSLLSIAAILLAIPLTALVLQNQKITFFNHASELKETVNINTSNIATSNCKYQFNTKWGTAGTGNGQFQSPWGITVDPSDNVFVIENNNHRVQKFNSNGVFITKWGSFGTSNSQFNYPTGITSDLAGNIYVADTTNNRIQKFSNNGDYLTQWGVAGSGPAQFNYPYSVASDSNGMIYVSDSNNNRVQKFTSTGTFVSQWAANHPLGISVDQDNNIYLMSIFDNTVYKYDSNGNLLTHWATNGSSEDSVSSDKGNNIYVLGLSTQQVEVFDRSGTRITTFGSSGTNNGQFQAPRGIEANSNQDVYVSDSGRNDIQKFSCQPQIQNGSFDSYNSTTLLPDFWTGSNLEPNDKVVTVSNRTGHVFRFGSSTSSNFRILTQKISINGKAGDHIHLDFLASSTATNFTKGWAFVSLQASNGIISTYSQSNFFSAAPGWNLQQLFLNTNADYSSLTVQVAAKSVPADVLFDDVKLTITPK